MPLNTLFNIIVYLIGLSSFLTLVIVYYSARSRADKKILYNEMVTLESGKDYIFIYKDGSILRKQLRFTAPKEDSNQLAYYVITQYYSNRVGVELRVLNKTTNVVIYYANLDNVISFSTEVSGGTSTQ